MPILALGNNCPCLCASDANGKGYIGSNPKSRHYCSAAGRNYLASGDVGFAGSICYSSKHYVTAADFTCYSYIMTM